MRLSILFAVASLLLLSSCDFRRPDDGYDSDWTPDHQAPANDQDNSNTQQQAEGGEENDLSADNNADRKRPGQITADTAQMAKITGEWEMVGDTPTSYTAYKNSAGLAMIAEKAGSSTRTYYFNEGALFYFNETSLDGSQSLTVEFDEIGDVIGARKTVGGERVHADEDDYAEIVKHAVELKMAAEAQK